MAKLTREEQELALEEIMDNYKNPKNFKKLEKYTIFEHLKNVSCGDSFDLYLNIENDKINEIGFFGEGCAISTASFSLATEFLKNKSIQELKEITKEEMLDLLLIDISSSKLNCALMPYQTLQNALKKLD